MNNPFDVNSNDSNPFDQKKANSSSKVIKVLIFIIIIFIIIVTIVLVTNFASNSIQGQELTEPQSVEEVGANINLTSTIASSCDEDEENCQRYSAGTEYQPGIYTATISFNFNPIADLVDSSEHYSDLPYVEFTTVLQDYQGLKRDNGEYDYYDFFIIDEQPITIQNVPLLAGSYINVYDNSKDLNIEIDLQPQTEYYTYNNEDPKSGFYPANTGIENGTYQIEGLSYQKYNTEFVPTSYQDYDIYELLDLYLANGDSFKVTSNSMIVVYDDQIKLV